jgi:predicted DNA-binding transcriptional regulator YafY
MSNRSSEYRRWEIDREIRTGNFLNARQLAEKLEVSHRTILRDIDHLRDQRQAPIEYDRKRKGYYYTDPNYFLPAVQLTEGELLAVFVAEKALKELQGTPYESLIRSAVSKLAEFLPENINVNIRELSDACDFNLGPVREVEAVLFRDLEEAVCHQKQVRITYHANEKDETTERVVDPYHLSNLKGDWYLIAFCHLRGKMRHFALSRIQKHEFTGKSFEKPDSFKLKEYLGDAMGIELTSETFDVAVKFDAHQARWIRERVWHPSERREELPDGSLILRFTTSSRYEVKSWILSHGSHAEVLSPVWLRDEIREEFEKARKNYAGNSQ